ncbi:hypothetical protein NECAME_16624, partial [Necator americanus]
DFKDSRIKRESRLGDICFSTRYRPATGTVTLTIMEARNLKKMDVGGSSAPPLTSSSFSGLHRYRQISVVVPKSIDSSGIDS